MQRVAPEFKRIGGKKYVFYEGFYYKKEAQDKALWLRCKGCSVRVVTLVGIRGHFLYVRDPRGIILKSPLYAV